MKIVGFGPGKDNNKDNEEDVKQLDKEHEWALELQEDFNLHMYSLAYITKIWKQYSKTQNVVWLDPYKSAVEAAFNITIKDTKYYR